MRVFEKAFRPPFRIDKWIHWVYDSNDNFCFQLQISPPDSRLPHIENLINGKVKPDNKVEYRHENGVIKGNNVDVILIRGWGYLTGTGGLNLSGEEAAEIQDDLANYLVVRFNGVDVSTGE